MSVQVSTSGGWIAFSEHRPEPTYDPKNPGRPTHGLILVTNNIEARDRWGHMSHVWLAGMVHYHETAKVWRGETEAEAGEITAYTEPNDRLVRHLTHWRPAVPEEWSVVAAEVEQLRAENEQLKREVAGAELGESRLLTCALTAEEDLAVQKLLTAEAESQRDAVANALCFLWGVVRLVSPPPELARSWHEGVSAAASALRLVGRLP